MKLVHAYRTSYCRVFVSTPSTFTKVHRMESFESTSDSRFLSKRNQTGAGPSAGRRGPVPPKVLRVGQVLGPHLRTEKVRGPKLVVNFISTVITLQTCVDSPRKGSCLLIGAAVVAAYGGALAFFLGDLRNCVPAVLGTAQISCQVVVQGCGFDPTTKSGRGNVAGRQLLPAIVPPTW
jgi:hypothetical protein